jgi:Xaa-Pro aminopeptidase
MGEFRPGALCRDYQVRTCELFEAMGHPTLKSNPQTETGYIHSLGHGVGLNIHERPWFSMRATDSDVLAPGSIFTVEPGLYYPDRGLGVRLENTVWVRPDGQMEVLAEYPMDLVLPVQGR